MIMKQVFKVLALVVACTMMSSCIAGPKADAKKYVKLLDKGDAEKIEKFETKLEKKYEGKEKKMEKFQEALEKEFAKELKKALK